MMTAKNAIYFMKMNIDFAKQFDENNSLIKAYEIAVDAMQKQLPKKVLEENGDFQRYMYVRLATRQKNIKWYIQNKNTVCIADNI